MIKTEIVNLLNKTHQELVDWIKNQPEEHWLFAPENKWTVGQHFLHLVESIELLNKALSIPRFILKYKYGVCNRENRSYKVVVKKYLSKLAENRERAIQFNSKLKTPTTQEKQSLLNRLEKQHRKLTSKTMKWNDKELDTLLLPHPLMGKMTVREIIMWSSYHTEHHTDILKEFY